MNNSECEASSADRTQSVDELSLFSLVILIRRHGIILLSSTLIGGTLGLAAAFVLPTQWEAVTLLRVAQLGGAPVEPPLRVGERVTQKSFGKDVLRRMDASLDEFSPKASLLLGSLKAKVEKSDLISIHVRGATSDEAARFVDAVIAELASVHTKMTEPALQRWDKEIKEIDKELNQRNDEIKQLNSVLEKITKESSVNNLYPAVLISNLLTAREAELRGFRERKRALQEQLSPERTFPTSSFGLIDVSTQPVFPKKSLFTAVGLIFGSLAGMLLSAIRLKIARTRR